MSLTVSATQLLTMLVSAQGCEASLAPALPSAPCLLSAMKLATLVLKLVTGPSMAPLVSAMNCSHTVFSRRSTSFLESRRCSWTAGAECRMNSSRALLLFIERMSDLETRFLFEIQSTQQFLVMSSCIYVDTCD